MLYVARLENPNYFSVLKEKNTVLIDVGKDVPHIKLLLGDDVIGQLLTGNVQHDKGLVAIETPVDWTVMGKQSSHQT